jgi:signal transduction histidine kinase
VQELAYNFFFDEASDLFWLWDKDHNLIDINKTALNTFNWKKEQVIGKNMVQLSPNAKESGRYEMYAEVIKTGKGFIIDDVVPHPSLGNFHFRVKAFKVGDGFGSMAFNITDLKEAINELEVFIYRCSHDMREPIASILGIVSLADRQIKSADEAKKYCAIVKQQTENLNRMLQTLVQTTGIRKGENVMHKINFTELIADVLKNFSSNEEALHVKFKEINHAKKPFYSDKVLLTSILQNLVDNSIKYRNEMISTAYVKIQVEDMEKGVMISVEDNGIGIPQNLQKDVFGIFFRASEKKQGSGLGLYTVKHIVKKLGGDLILKSTERKGTIITFMLPTEEINEIIS